MRIEMRLSRRLTLIVLAIFLPIAAQPQSPEPPKPPSFEASFEGTAQLIGVLPEFTELQRLYERQKLSSGNAPEDRWQILWLHQHISEEVLAASLQVDATIAQIDNEIARANEVHSYLSDRRDRTVNRANLLGVIVGGGLGATSSGLQLSSTLTKPAAGVGIGAGALSAGFGIAGIHAQKGGTSQFDFQSNMLAQLFDRPVLPDSQYPATLWKFLNEEPRSGPAGATRRQQLLDTWVQVRRIDSLASADKIDRLTSQPSEMLRLTIDDFEDRAAMLQDVRARISFLKRDLGVLLADLSAIDSTTGIQP
jgi:hypothetical protein